MDRHFRDEMRVVWSRETGGIMAHDAVHVLLKWEPSDEDLRLLMRHCSQIVHTIQVLMSTIFLNPYRLTFNRTVIKHPRVLPWCAEIAISCDRLMKPRGARWRVDRVHLNPFKRTCLIDDRVDPSPCDGCFAIVSDAHGDATSLAKENFWGNVVPHRRNRGKNRIYKVGRHNLNALLPQYYNQGPLTRGPFTCQPSRHESTRASAWTRVALPRIRATCAPPARRVGLRGSATWPCVPRCILVGPARHVSSACHVSSAGPAENKPLFVIVIKQ